jgi:hypothetical protein
MSRSYQFTVRRLLLIMVAVAGVMGLLSAVVTPSHMHTGYASGAYTDAEGNLRSYLYPTTFFVVNDKIVEWKFQLSRLLISLAMLLAVGFLWKTSAPQRAK